MAACFRPSGLVDIACNLTDPMFTGVYGGRSAHTGDLANVLRRAADAGVGKVVVAAGSLDDARHAVWGEPPEHYHQVIRSCLEQVEPFLNVPAHVDPRRIVVAKMDDCCFLAVTLTI